MRYDEEARWLTLRRGPYELACNFGTWALRLPCTGDTLELAAGNPSSPAQLADGVLSLPAMSGALIR